MKQLFVLMIACLVTAAPLAAWAADTPAPVRALEAQGIQIKGSFSAPDGLTGYAASYQGQPLAVYLLADGKHAIVGTMVDAHGNDMSREHLRKLVANPDNQKAWSQLEDATWVTDGADDAPRTIYMFMDANCPFCHQFWRQARPWVDAGKVQIRHVLVGILKPSSMPKAAAILAANDPSAALKRSEENYENGGIKAMDNPPSDVVKKIGENTDLMRTLGYFATPTILYKDGSGNVAVKQGVPQGAQAMAEVMGSKKPH